MKRRYSKKCLDKKIPNIEVLIGRGINLARYFHPDGAISFKQSGMNGQAVGEWLARSLGFKTYTIEIIY